MRLLVVSQYYRPENFRVNDLVAWLLARGHEVVVLTGLPNYPKGKFYEGYSVLGPWTERLGHLKVIRVPLVSRGLGGGLRLTLNYASFALTASILGPLRCRGRFDAIFVHEPSPITVGIPAVILRALKRCPLYFWVLDLWPESLEATGAVRSQRVICWVRRLTSWIYRHCDWVLMQSRAFASRIADFGIDARRLLYFPNWAEPELHATGEIGGEMLVDASMPRGFRVVYTGNIGDAQDFPTILAAAESLRDQHDIHWILVGDGRTAEWVRSEITRRGLERQVHMLGGHPPESMPLFFASADTLLVSLRAEPIFSLTVPAKVQAYLVAGRPIVAALDGEGASIIEESGSGLTCPAGDPVALARRIMEMRALPAERRASMGRLGRAYATEHFDREQLLKRLEGWMKGEGLPDGLSIRIPEKH